MKQYFVYITTNKIHTVLYTGVTSNLSKRVYQHENSLTPGFTARYNVDILVYYQEFPTMLEAITAEKRIKGWNRAKKIALIKTMNPELKDLNDRGPAGDPSASG